MTIPQFRRIVWAHYTRHGRHGLPWRNTRDPYRVLVSEIMLQQTQVERVIPFYAEFTKRFPTAEKLAAAPLSAVLKAWQGLGYNRRAKMLHTAAKELRTGRSDLKNAGRSDLPVLLARLEKLPGVGPYTARAVAAFAFNEDVIVIETNIRTAVIHHFFAEKKKVSDADIERVLKRALPKGRAREWYGALMDYGAHLKRSGVSHNARSAAYAKQPAFAGSLREARGAILRALARGERAEPSLMDLLGGGRRAQMRRALAALRAEGLVQKKGNRVLLPDGRLTSR